MIWMMCLIILIIIIKIEIIVFDDMIADIEYNKKLKNYFIEHVK